MNMAEALLLTPPRLDDQLEAEDYYYDVEDWMDQPSRFWVSLEQFLKTPTPWIFYSLRILAG
jgi:hypothetical protein